MRLSIYFLCSNNNFFWFLYNFRGSNVKFENDDLIDRINCYCHLLSNLVGQMCSIESVKTFVDSTMQLVSYVRNSGLGVKCEPKLRKYISTRWNSVYDMMASVCTNYTKLGEILLEKERADKTANVMGKLTKIPRSSLEIIAEFLKKFKEWTKHLETEKKPTLWMVWPIYVHLQKYLSDQSTDSDIIKAMKQCGRNYIEKKENDFKPRMIHKIATVLHPLLKNIASASSEDRNEIYDSIRSCIDKYASKTDKAIEREITTTQTENQDIIDDFMGCSSDETFSNQMNIADDFERYLSIKLGPINPFDFNLLEWWFKNRLTFPNLFRLFLSLSGITAASSSAERSFSETEIIITARRSNTSPENVSNLVLARNVFLHFL